MKRKIILSLLAIFVLFTLGASTAIFNLARITSELQGVIELQQIEQLRRSLVMDLQRVQTNLYAINSPYSEGVDSIIENVAELEESLQKCTTCHHPPSVYSRIAGINSLVNEYQSSLSYYMTARADSERTRSLKTDAVEIGNRLLEVTEDMSHRATENLNAESVFAMQHMDSVRQTLVTTLTVTFLMGIFAAIILTRSVTRPVNELLKATRKISAGEFGARTSYRDGSEFGELAEHFNSMSTAVRDGYEKIQKEIDERTHAEEALIQSQEFLGTIFDSIRDPFCILDREFRIIKTNAAYAELKEVTPQELVGRKCFEVLHNRSSCCADCVVDITFRSKDPCAKDKFFSGRDGVNVWMEVYTYPIVDDNGDVSHVIEYTRDITDRKRTEENLKKSEERYALAARGANDGLWDWDLQSDIIYYSSRWKSMLGFKENELSHSPEEWLSRIHPDQRVQVEMEIASHINGKSYHFRSEHRLLHNDGTYRWILARGLSVARGNEKAHRMVGSITDITERKKAEEQLVFDALHDALTGLPNRSLFMDRLGHAVSREKRTTSYLFAVLFLDIDRFKVINDSMGHSSGDALLVSAGKRLEESLRPGDTVARLGGDEFAILLEDLASRSEAIFIAERIQEKLSEAFILNGQEVFVSASTGIAFSTTGYEHPEHLLRNADIAMYRAKANSSKGRYKIFDTGMYASAVARLEMETSIRQALNQKEFLFHYQPIISSDEGIIESVEALIRWEHPVRGLVMPDEFIPIAEDTGLITQIGTWAIREACRQLSAWKKEFPSCQSLTVSVNMSIKQLVPNLVSKIQETLQEFGLRPEDLVLEITESMIMENAEQVLPLLQEMRTLEVKLHIDDFGTGYSSLSYLHQFPVDMLKIDRSFVKRIGSDSDNLEIIRAITTLANNLNMEVIAEGVETENQFAQLKNLNCRYMQGYLFSRPLSRKDIEALLRKGRIDLITHFTRTSFSG